MVFFKKSSTSGAAQASHPASTTTGSTTTAMNPPAANSSWKKLQRPLSIVSHSQDIANGLLVESPTSSMLAHSVNHELEQSHKRSLFSSLRKKSAPTVETTGVTPRPRSGLHRHTLSKRASMPLDGLLSGSGSGSSSVRSRISSQSIRVIHNTSDALPQPEQLPEAPRRSSDTDYKSTAAASNRDVRMSTATDLFIQNELAILNTPFNLLDPAHKRMSLSLLQTASPSMLGSSTSTVNSSNDNGLVSPAPSAETFESAGYSMHSSKSAGSFSSAPSSIAEDDEDEHAAATTTAGKPLPPHRVSCGVVWVGGEAKKGSGDNDDVCIKDLDDFEDEDLDEYEYHTLRPRMLRIC